MDFTGDTQKNEPGAREGHLNPSVHYGLSFDEYKKLGGMNSGGIQHILLSAAHYQAYLTQPEKLSDALKFGQVAHAAILEPERFRKNMVLAPDVDRRTKIGKEAYANFQASLGPESIVVSEDWLEDLTGMMNSVSKAADAYISKGQSEVSVFFLDRETQAPCRARFDFINSDGLLFDLKTTGYGKAPHFDREATNYKYMDQVAHYLAAARASDVCKPIFNFLVVEKEKPWGVKIYQASDFLIEKGEERRKKAMKIYADCLNNDKWPSYDPSPDWLGLAPWLEEN